MDKTVCELFAGVGGFRVGLERASKDWNTVWANQWEPSRARQDAFDCYCAHFGKEDTHVNVDIGLIDKATIPDHTLLVGGFPCQDYSVAATGPRASRARRAFSGGRSTIRSKPSSRRSSCLRMSIAC